MFPFLGYHPHPNLVAGNTHLPFCLSFPLLPFWPNLPSHQYHTLRLLSSGFQVFHGSIYWPPFTFANLIISNTNRAGKVIPSRPDKYYSGTRVSPLVPHTPCPFKVFDQNVTMLVVPTLKICLCHNYRLSIPYFHHRPWYHKNVV